MSEYAQNQNNPSGIWQHIWVTLIMQTLEALYQKRYSDAWESAQNLMIEIPPECQMESQTAYDKVQKIFETDIQGWSRKNINEKKLMYISANAPSTIRAYLKEVTHSLFKNNWINKSFGAKPKFSGGGTL